MKCVIRKNLTRLFDTISFWAFRIPTFCGNVGGGCLSRLDRSLYALYLHREWHKTLYKIGLKLNFLFFPKRTSTVFYFTSNGIAPRPLYRAFTTLWVIVLAARVLVRGRRRRLREIKKWFVRGRKKNEKWKIRVRIIINRTGGLAYIIYSYRFFRPANKTYSRGRRYAPVDDFPSRDCTCSSSLYGIRIRTLGPVRG